MTLRCSLVVVLAGAIAAAPPAEAQGSRLTVARLEALKASSNDPAGDSFGGTRPELMTLIDDFVADNALASPLYLYLAANTAMRLDRIDDAAFLFYAAQLRRAFDFQRYDMARMPEGQGIATYFGFLNETTGMSINPAIMRRPPQFAAVVAKLEKWDLVPSPKAYYPEFAEAKGFKVPAAEWPALARQIKQGFMEQFGKRMVTVLSDKAYFDAFLFVQQVNLGEIESTPAVLEKYEATEKQMEAMERRLLGEPLNPRRAPEPKPSPAPAPAPPAETRAAAPAAAPASVAIFRVGDGVKEPVLVTRVDPVYPPNAMGNVILEVTVGPTGSVTDVRVLRGDAPISDAAVAAVKQWRYQPTTLSGKPVSVVTTVVLQKP
jgi:TonB family protein